MNHTTNGWANDTTNGTTTNGTTTNGAINGGPPNKVGIVGVVFFCIVSLIIVFGNSLVIGAFRVNRRLRTKTNLLLISLAIADLLIGTISVPLYVYLTVVPQPSRAVSNFYLPFDVVCGVSSILNLTAISLERCYALLHPIKHRNIRKRVILVIILVAWLLASFAGSMREFLENKQYYGIIVTVVFFFVPLVIILAAYGTIFHIARAHARGRGVSSFKKDLRIATTVAVVIGLFVICWTPFFALNFTFAICLTTGYKGPGCLGLMTIPQYVLSINKWLQYGNSVCNPIIYGLRNQDFRRAFRKILMSMCCKKVRLDDFSKSTYGRTVRTRLQRESSFENSRSVIYPPNEAVAVFDARESYRKAIQSGRSKPIKLKFKKKSLTDGILAMNMDAFHSLPSTSDSTSRATLFSTSSEISSSTVLCNPSLEDNCEEAEIYPIEQAKDSNENKTGSTTSVLKNSLSGSLQNGEVRVRFKDSHD
ncbi:histamine H2 receptor-like [Montipora capricornis]|uniref:histamine H2 receptor-like n=1 Tax=Montipora capricornis TaxID=246305 RepID=UPI0035F18809